MPATSQDTGFAEALQTAWESDPNNRPAAPTSANAYPTTRGLLRPPPLTDSE